MTRCASALPSIATAAAEPGRPSMRHSILRVRLVMLRAVRQFWSTASTLWLSNVMLAERDVESEQAALISALENARGQTVVVTNEVGLGIVPENALARRFRDAQGRLNARVAEIADRVVLIAAGLPLTLKPQSQEGHAQ